MEPQETLPTMLELYRVKIEGSKGTKEVYCIAAENPGTVESKALQLYAYGNPEEPVEYFNTETVGWVYI